MATQLQLRRGTTQANDLFTGANGEVTVDTTTHELRVHDGFHQGGYKVGAGGISAGRNIGDVFMTKRTDTALAGAVECNGGTYNTEDYTGTGSIGELLEAGKLDYISLTAYATAISTKGWCDKIGWNGTGTTSFRVPTLTPHIIQKNNIPVVGNGYGLGLKDSSSTQFLMQGMGGSAPNNTYALSESSTNGTVGTTGSRSSLTPNQIIGVSTDPTKSGIIADTSDTAQLRVMIQLANGATYSALETCTGVLADVANLKDLSNITATGKETVVGWGMPDYTSGTSLSLTAGQTYTATYNQMICAIISWGTSGASEVLIRTSNDTSSASNIIFGGRGSNYNWGAYNLYLKKGQSLYIQILSGVYSFTAYPIIGG